MTAAAMQMADKKVRAHLSQRVAIRCQSSSLPKHKHGVFCSVTDIQAALNRFVAKHNETEARRLIWRVDPDAIIASQT